MEILFLFLIPLLTGLVSLWPKTSAWLGRIQSAGMLLLCGSSFLLIQKIMKFGVLHYLGNSIYLDALSGLMIMLIALISLFSSIYANGYMINEVEEKINNIWKLKGFYALLNLFILTMLLVVTTNSLGILWIGIEATTLVSAFLVGYYNRKTTVEAAWKYIILCTVGIVFALIGIILTYYAAIQANGIKELGLNWDYLLQIGHQLDPKLMKIAFVFILVGYGTKAGLAPMHTWLPDAHSEAPTPISALLSGVLLKCGLYAIIRFSILANAAIGGEFVNHTILLFGMLSLAIATPFIIVQHNIKRMLAYHSLEHIGIIAIGIGFGTPLAVFGALFHIINHAMVKSLMFFTSGNLALKFHSKTMGQIQGTLQIMPLSGTALVLGGLALAGSPPFSIFVSEFYILNGGIQGNHWVASILFVLFLVIIFGALTHHILHMAVGPPPIPGIGSRIIPKGEICRSGVAAILLPLSASLILAWWIPSPLLQLLHQSVRIVTGGSI